MAVYKIFPVKDASIYSRYPCKNTGIDEILEVSSKNSRDYLRYVGRKDSSILDSPYYNYDFPYTETVEGFGDAPDEDIRRSLLYFSNEDINILKSFNSASYSASLKLFLAHAQNLSTDYTIECMPLTQSWDMGTGRFHDVPENRTGVCWSNVGNCNTSVIWNASLGTTVINIVPGGGVWNSSLKQTQSFDYTSDKDVNINITPILAEWFTNNNTNSGLIVKHTDAVELNTSSYIDIKYYSQETHTVFGPQLEFKWDDSIFVPITGSGAPVRFNLKNNIVINFENNKGQFKEDSTYVFRLKCRDRFPTRQFSTSSVYLNWKYLMEGSTWAIQDTKTEDMIIDFDDNFTKISADQNGNYFKVHMKGLHPERYYKLLIKTKVLSTNEGVLASLTNDQILTLLEGYTSEQVAALPYTETIFDDNEIFKIIR